MDTFDLVTEELKAGIKDISTTELVRMKNELQQNLSVPGNINPRARPAALANKRVITETIMVRQGRKPDEVRDVHHNIVEPPTEKQKSDAAAKQKRDSAKFDTAVNAARQERLKPVYEHAVKENLDLGWEQSQAEKRAAKATGYSSPSDGD